MVQEPSVHKHLIELVTRIKVRIMTLSPADFPSALEALEWAKMEADRALAASLADELESVDASERETLDMMPAAHPKTFLDEHTT